MNSEHDINDQNLTKLQNLLQDNTILLNRANFCGHCHQFTPEFTKYTEMAKAQHMNIVELENDALSKIRSLKPQLYDKVTSKEGLYFPMVIIYIKNKVKHLYEGPRTADAIRDTIAHRLPVVRSAPVKKSTASKSAPAKKSATVKSAPVKSLASSAAKTVAAAKTARAARIIAEAKKNKK